MGRFRREDGGGVDERGRRNGNERNSPGTKRNSNCLSTPTLKRGQWQYPYVHSVRQISRRVNHQRELTPRKRATSRAHSFCSSPSFLASFLPQRLGSIRAVYPTCSSCRSRWWALLTATKRGKEQGRLVRRDKERVSFIIGAGHCPHSPARVSTVCTE